LKELTYTVSYLNDDALMILHSPVFYDLLLLLKSPDSGIRYETRRLLRTLWHDESLPRLGIDTIVALLR
jgi:hypothetical protein